MRDRGAVGPGNRPSAVRCGLLATLARTRCGDLESVNAAMADVSGGPETSRPPANLVALAASQAHASCHGEAVSRATTSSAMKGRRAYHRKSSRFMRAAPSPCPVDLGQQTEETATLRVGCQALPDGASLRGAVRGPFCRYARTLAADFPVDPAGVSVITEPCYWTAILPGKVDARCSAGHDSNQRPQIGCPSTMLRTASPRCFRRRGRWKPVCGSTASTPNSVASRRSLARR